MKYYYGNSYKEAVSNNPVEINDTKILENYKENYNVVIPADGHRERNENNEDTRIIVLVDCDTQFLVSTDAPANLIDAAIEYKNKLLENDEPISSDFEAMQDYLNKEGYSLEEIGYVSDIESYLW